MIKPHEDPNCNCKACAEWHANLSPLLKAWEAEWAGWTATQQRHAAICLYRDGWKDKP